MDEQISWEKFQQMLAKMYFLSLLLMELLLIFLYLNVTVEKTNDTYDIAQLQTHNIYTTVYGFSYGCNERTYIADFKKDPEEILNDREKEAKPLWQAFFI